MQDQNNTPIFLGIFQCVDILNSYSFYQNNSRSTLGLSSIAYRNSLFENHGRSTLDLSTVCVEKIKSTINDNKVNKFLVFNKLNSIQDLLSETLAFNKKSNDLLLSHFFHKIDIKRYSHSYPFFKGSLNIDQNFESDFVEISVSQSFKAKDSLYIKVPKLKAVNHLIEIYCNKDHINLFPDSENNAIIFKFKKDTNNLKFSFRVSEFSSENLLAIRNIKSKSNDIPVIRLSTTDECLVLDRKEVFSLNFQQYKKVELTSSRELSLLLSSNKQYQKTNFLYVTDFSKEQTYMEFLMEASNIGSITYHTLCRLRQYSQKGGEQFKKFKACDWKYYNDIYRIVEHLVADFTLNRSMNKIRNTTGLPLYNELKLILQNKKYSGDDKIYIPFRVLNFLKEKGLFVSYYDEMLCNNVAYMRKVIYDTKGKRELDIHSHLKAIDSKNIPFLYLELQKYANNIPVSMDIIKALSSKINQYFDLLTKKPLLHVKKYVFDGGDITDSAFEGFDYATTFAQNKNAPEDKPKKTKTISDAKKIGTIRRNNRDNNNDNKKSFFKSKTFIGVCVGGSVLAVVGGAVYVLI
ncbi:hypothetical protein CDIK_0773 [Cucumispora dikerogammari]|nr:hypothetical protein CDIK_0773 [Cucumispora dikerogammari]